MNKLKKPFGRGLIPALIIGAVLLSGCAYESGGAADEPYAFSDIYFGTVVNIRLYGEEETADSRETRIRAILDDIENSISRRIPESGISVINNKRDGEYSEVPKEIGELLLKCRDISEKTEGTFDITIGRLVTLWNIDELSLKDGAQSIPAPSDIEEALKTVGYDNLIIKKTALTGADSYEVILNNGAGLDVGAVGKGYAFDKLKEAADAPIVASLGGSIFIKGDKPDGTPWRVGVVDPFDTSDMAGSIVIADAGEGICVSTSGDYERYITVDGVRYHHILDPHTGYPAKSGVRSVTVVSHDGVLSDALSTALFVMGADEGMRLLDEYEDAEALFILEDDSIIMTERMKALWQEKQ